LLACANVLFFAVNAVEGNEVRYTVVMPRRAHVARVINAFHRGLGPIAATAGRPHDGRKSQKLGKRRQAPFGGDPHFSDKRQTSHQGVASGGSRVTSNELLPGNKPEP
jgi:hypothetical protein